jgi:hypothetical protein
MTSWKVFVHPPDAALKLQRGRTGIIRYGPSYLGLRYEIHPSDGPEQFVQSNPQLFATGTTSRDEGYGFWALLKLIGPEGGEIGKNGMAWYYQSKTGEKGSAFATVDFVIEILRKTIGIRVVTPWFHIQAGPAQRAFDEEQVYFLISQGMSVVDVYSQNYINDDTGRAALKVYSQAISDAPDLLPIARHWR